jgi:GDP-L-fucose synthase
MPKKFNDKIFVAGHNGLVGSAIVRTLKLKGYKNIITVDKKNINLLNQKKTFSFLKKIKPKFVFIAAAKVGGIKTNNLRRADFLYENLSIQNNLIHGSYLAGVKNLLFLSSSCVYPKHSKQPIKEEYLLTGIIEKTNEPYAIAKIAGMKLCESYSEQYNLNYKSLMPSNLYGPNDNYDLETAHFLPSLIKKIYKLKKKKLKILNLWGRPDTRREFLYVDDLANACVYFMKKKIKESFVNIGLGKDYTIDQTSKILLDIVGIKATIKYNHNLIGTKRKLLDVTKAKKYGWKYQTELREGLEKTYRNYNKF